MSWKKYFTPVPTGDNQSGSYSPFSGRGTASRPGPARSNYSSFLPDVYVGTPNRVERYGCLLYTSPSPRDRTRSRMPSSA